MSPPRLLPRYTFRLTELTVMWAHPEAEIALSIAQAGDLVDVGVTVTHACDPFGDHPEWQWTTDLALSGVVTAAADPAMVRIVPDAPGVVAALTFDPARAVHDTGWSDGDPWARPPHDFWHPLFHHGWAAQHRSWPRQLTEDALASAVGGARPLMPVDERDRDWAVAWRQDRLRYHQGRSFSAARGCAYPIDPEARFERRRFDRPHAGWALVFHACPPERIAAILVAAPGLDAEPAAHEAWYRLHAGRRAEYFYGWLPAEREREVDRWLAVLDDELAARRP